MMINKGKQIKERIKLAHERTDGMTTAASTLITVLFYYVWFNRGEIGNQLAVRLLIIATFSLLVLSILFQAEATYYELVSGKNRAFNLKIRDRLNVIDGPVDPRERKLKELQAKTKRQKVARNRKDNESNIIEFPSDSKK